VAGTWLIVLKLVDDAFVKETREAVFDGGPAGAGPAVEHVDARAPE